MTKHIKAFIKLSFIVGLGVLVSGCVATEYNTAESMRLTAAKNKNKKKRAKGEKIEPIVVIHKSLPKKRKHRYFVEFRSRPNGLTSHSYVAYGRLYSRGRLRRVKLVGLHPKNGSAGFLVGSVVGMEAQLKPVWGDKNVAHTVSFRVPITYKQYRKIDAFVKAEKKKKHTWNLVLNNCNGFVGRVAGLVGLDSPGATAIPPALYVKNLIEVNT